MWDGFLSYLWQAIDCLQTYNGAVTAFATVWIAIFTIVLALVSRRQAKLTRQSINLATKEFVSTHRPKIVVRELMILPESHPLQIRYVIANVGASDATIVESHIELQDVGDRILRPLQPIEGANPVGNVTLAAGTQIFREQNSRISRIDFNTNVFREERIQDLGHLVRQPRLFFRGFIVYVDANDVRRRTAFCRRYELPSQRFRASEDPDYEYAD